MNDLRAGTFDRDGRTRVHDDSCWSTSSNKKESLILRLTFSQSVNKEEERVSGTSLVKLTQKGLRVGEDTDVSHTSDLDPTKLLDGTGDGLLTHTFVSEKPVLSRHLFGRKTPTTPGLTWSANSRRDPRRHVRLGK